MKKLDWILMSAVVILIVSALVFAALPKEGEERFSGADGQAEKAISAIAPGYKPWASPLWEPPSGEVESLLFSLQAAIGAGLIGYFFGKKAGAKQRNAA